MKEQEIIEETIEFVKKTLADTEKGHDWDHIHRVWNLSKTIAKKENANMFIVEMGALLHDIADPKFHDGDEDIGPKTAKTFLENINLDCKLVDEVIKIVENVSFRKSFEQKFKSKELEIVQDADRLDAMGAIGITRAFHYGGYKNKKIYDPGIKPHNNISREEYKKEDSPTINHFYEKLLLLKDRMNTKTGKELAEKRHRFMEQFLEEFYKEWDGKE
ncbi:MAG: HD domain-containing protein [Nanoarchaeota archaeon]